MGWSRRCFAFLTILVLLVATPALARAGEGEPGPGCVRLVGESSESFAITIGPRCDLREAARLFPQVDPETGRTLPMQEQLRSIFAMNEARHASGQSKVRTVGRACVPTGQAPGSATAEELEICPRGLVNYFGVASHGSVAVIQVPKARVLTRAQRLDALARSACSALSGTREAGSGGRATEVVSGCRQLLGNDAVAAPAPQASEEPPAPSVKALTPEPESRQKQAEPRAQPAAARWPAQPSDGRGSYAVLFLIALALAGGGFGWLRYRNDAARAAATAAGGPAHEGKVVVDRDMLSRAMLEVNREFKARLDQERSRHEQEIERWRTMAQELEDRLRQRTSQPAPEPARRRAAREKEENLQAEIQRMQEAHLAEVSARDDQIARLQGAREGIERQLAGLNAELLKHRKREVSLRTRLSAARQKGAGSSLRPREHHEAGAGGLPAPRAEAGFAVAFNP
ncbi:MAG: hypothetical protein HY898_33520 [Deltaproteobacteria bacterium]|nr:hypothetical protein [Deltaproteobacteria bacterium]